MFECHSPKSEVCAALGKSVGLSAPSLALMRSCFQSERMPIIVAGFNAMLGSVGTELNG